MDKETAELELVKVVEGLEELLDCILHNIGDVNNEEHELQPILQLVTDMYAVYERDVEIN
jgi:hypothetical protein